MAGTNSTTGGPLRNGEISCEGRASTGPHDIGHLLPLYTLKLRTFFHAATRRLDANDIGATAALRSAMSIFLTAYIRP